MITEQPPLSIDWNDVIIDFCPASVSASDIEHIASVPIRVVNEMCFRMCYGWSSLVDVNGLANWDTSGVTTVQDAFCECERLRDASGLERWTLTGVDDVKTMLCQCPQLDDEERKYIIAAVSGHVESNNDVIEEEEDTYGSNDVALQNDDESEMSEGDYSDLDESSDDDDKMWIETIRELSDEDDGSK